MISKSYLSLVQRWRFRRPESLHGNQARRIYRPDSVRRVDPGGQSFLWPGHCWPDLAIYPHAWTSRPSRSADRTHAYLMLLPVEVAAFHPATPRPMKERATRKSPCLCADKPCPLRRLVSVALFLGNAAVARRAPGRPLAATAPCGVRTFLDTRGAPRLPDPSCGRYFRPPADHALRHGRPCRSRWRRTAPRAGRWMRIRRDVPPSIACRAGCHRTGSFHPKAARGDGIMEKRPRD